MPNEVVILEHDEDLGIYRAEFKGAKATDREPVRAIEKAKEAYLKNKRSERVQKAFEREM